MIRKKQQHDGPAAAPTDPPDPRPTHVVRVEGGVFHVRLVRKGVGAAVRGAAVHDAGDAGVRDELAGLGGEPVADIDHEPVAPVPVVLLVVSIHRRLLLFLFPTPVPPSMATEDAMDVPPLPRRQHRGPARKGHDARVRPRRVGNVGQGDCLRGGGVAAGLVQPRLAQGPLDGGQGVLEPFAAGPVRERVRRQDAHHEAVGALALGPQRHVHLGPAGLGARQEREGGVPALGAAVRARRRDSGCSGRGAGLQPFLVAVVVVGVFHHVALPRAAGEVDDAGG